MEGEMDRMSASILPQGENFELVFVPRGRWEFWFDAPDQDPNPEEGNEAGRWHLVPKTTAAENYLRAASDDDLYFAEILRRNAPPLSRVLYRDIGLAFALESRITTGGMAEALEAIERWFASAFGEVYAELMPECL